MKRPNKLNNNFNAIEYYNHLDELNKYIDFLENKQSKQFSLQDVVASVLCVKSKGYKDLQKGKKYELIDELVLDYVIVDDEGCNYRYPKELFERIK